MPYSMLSGVRVLEVAWLAGDAVGQQLADMGAEVIKIEHPTLGDYVRTVGPWALGGGQGLSFMHLHWNRGKKSIALDLKSPEGKATFLRLAEKSDVVLEGLRSGTLAGWGLGYDELREVNPAIVFCSLSGMGGSGPYRELPTHGFFFDAFTGLAPPRMEDGEPYAPAERGGLLEYNAGGLYAALGVTAALVRAKQTGEGAAIDVAQTDSLALLRSEKLEVALNARKIERRASYGDGEGFANSVRSAYYRTSDDRVIFVQALERKFWENLCRAVGREDLRGRFPRDLEYDHAADDEQLRGELRAIFITRTLDEWLELFLQESIPGGPVYALEDLLDDPHFQARGHVREVEHPEFGTLYLTGTPIQVAGEEFDPALAPSLGEHTEYVLRDVLALGDEEIERLAESSAVPREHLAGAGNALPAQ